MPLKSKAQRRWMWANNPEMAERWEKHTADKTLPEKVKKTAMSKTLLAAVLVKNAASKVAQLGDPSNLAATFTNRNALLAGLGGQGPGTNPIPKPAPKPTPAPAPAPVPAPVNASGPRNAQEWGNWRADQQKFYGSVAGLPGGQDAARHLGDHNRAAVAADAGAGNAPLNAPAPTTSPVPTGLPAPMPAYPGEQPPKM